MKTKEVVVIGAGVVGLTTAITIQEQGGYNVTIVAETWPSDPKTVKYTSFWAGASHGVYRGPDENLRKVRQDTFKVMWELSAPGGPAEACFHRTTEHAFYYDGLGQYADDMPNLKRIPESELRLGAKAGYSFSSYVIDPPVYLNYLLSRFIARGGHIVRGTVQHISQVIEGGTGIWVNGKPSAAPDALVVCNGLGAKTLGGVEDAEVYPNRGQNVIVHAPWVRDAMSLSSPEPTIDTYVFPRRNGDVVLGTVRVPHDWYPVARPETTTQILERCLALCPELAPPEIRAQRAPTIDDLRPLIVEETCGLRPMHVGGIRMEVNWIDGRERESKIPMLLNYGYGPSGYEPSWGSAKAALEMLEGALANVVA
ncbi:D-amino-acid oxidase [Rhodofomes roseus]|uniref:D-amino-acid oxidase n=1 Tax=Rhodofomes roseus TaxID=34475 RepID=A0ABQ8KCS8_9APHY|nr:D-amino-acid oxidase [Rhodofomes roseus]KAH9835403.1 D-amino-acid oxidase [Rhodofomes roseus]